MSDKKSFRRRAFTLIELMVVIGIIVLLIAILIPALGAIKSAGYKTATTSMLSQLSSDCDAYYKVFSAYPGAAPTSVTSNTGGKLSGTQNLLISLSYTMYVSNAPGTALTIPGGSVKVDPKVASGPVDFANINPLGQPTQVNPFFSPTSREVSQASNGTWPPSGITTTGSGNSFAFPVILDAYPDALPILYYRRTPGVNTTPVALSGICTYNFNENVEYTGNNGSSVTLTASSGVGCVQNAGGPGGGTFDTDQLEAEILQNSGALPASPTMPGGYVLIAASSSRAYGRTASLTKTTVTAGSPVPETGTPPHGNGDIVVVGGGY